MRTLLILLGLFIQLTNIYSQPINDDKIGAKLLAPLEWDCNVLNFSTIGATPSTPSNSCSYNSKDVWFKFEHKALDLIKVQLNHKNSSGAATSNPLLEIYGDHYNVSHYCVREYLYENGTLDFMIYELPKITDTVYLRVYFKNSIESDFSICLSKYDLSEKNVVCENSFTLNLEDECNSDTWHYNNFFYLNEEFLELDSCLACHGGLWYNIELPAFTNAAVRLSFESKMYGLNVIIFDYDSCATLSNEISYNLNSEENYAIPLSNSTEDDKIYKLFLRSNWNNNEFNPMKICASLTGEFLNEICEQSLAIIMDGGKNLCDQSFYFNSLIARPDSTIESEWNKIFTDVWFSYFNQEESNLLITADFQNGSAISLIIELFKRSCDDLELVGNYASNQELYFNKPNQEYLIRIGTEVGNLVKADLCFSFLEPPINDQIENAILINNQSQEYSFDLTGSTSSPEDICSPYPDIWYKFEYKAQENQIVELIETFINIYDAELSLYKELENGLEPVYCTVGWDGIAIHNPDLINETIFLAVQKPNFNVFRFYPTGKIKFTQENQSPGLGEYCSIAKEVLIDKPCQSYDIKDALFSGITDPCNFYQHQKDVWVKFNIPESGRLELNYSLQNEFEEPKGNVSLYYGSCNNLNFLHCFQPELGLNVKQLNLIVISGSELFIKMSGTLYENLVFDFCIKSVDYLPRNSYDNCHSSLELEVQSNECTNPIISSNENAMYSEQVSLCSAYQGSDIWFSFMMPESGRAEIVFSQVANSPVTDGIMALYKGTCNQLEWIACDDDGGFANMPALFINDINLANQILYIQFYSYNNLNQGEVGLCILEPPTTVADYCAEAIHVESLSEESCISGEGTSAQIAFNDYSSIQPDCTNDLPKDLWFEFDYDPENAQVFITETLQGSPLQDAKAALYAGNCDSLEFIICKDDNGPGDMPMFDLQEILSPIFQTDKIYIQFWNVNPEANGAFQYCLFEKFPNNIEDIKPKSLLLYPNPAAVNLFVKLKHSSHEVTYYFIYDVSGRVVLGGNEIDQINEDLIIDISYLENGLYILKFSTGDDLYTAKFLKQ